MMSNPNGAATNPELQGSDQAHPGDGNIVSRLLSSDPMGDEK